MLPAERCSLKGGDARDDGVVGVLPPAACASVPEGGVGAHVTPAARLVTELCSVLTELVTELTAAPAFLCSWLTLSDALRMSPPKKAAPAPSFDVRGALSAAGS